jgi:hypothetical protein
MKDKKLSQAAKLIAKKGGNATLKKHGIKFYKKIAKKRWAKSRSKAKK